jgi:hypothetical protein
MKKYRDYSVILVLAYLAFSFIANSFDPIKWTKSDKVMCIVIVAVGCTSRMYIDEQAEK